MAEQSPEKDVAASEQAQASKPVATAADAKKLQEWRKKCLLSYQKINKLLWITVILPTLISGVYFTIIASDQYISESSFVVRSARSQASLSGLGALLQSAGLSRSQDDTYTVQAYMTSRTALATLEKQLPIQQFYEQEGDVFSRFNALGLENSKEAFYQYFRDKVHIDFDAVSGISVLRVRAFHADEAQKINQALLTKGEDLINQLNERARQDTIAFAEKNVARAEERVKEVGDRFMEYRISNGIFDLKEQSGVQLGLVSKLQDELIMIQTQLEQVRSLAPDNPQILGLRARERSLREQIAQQISGISGRGQNSMASKAAGYQRLYLEDQLAQKELTAAMASLESAKAEASRQQLYLEVIAKPSQPDLAELPRRLYNIVATFIIGLIVYGILSLLGASIREHKN